MSATVTETPRVAIEDIVIVEDFNPRTSFDKTSFDELVDSVTKNDVLQPVLTEVRDDGKHVLIAGHRRVAAAKKAGKKTIPFHAVDAGDEAITLAVIENLQRENLNPVDEARGFKMVLDAGKLNQGELAAKISKAPSTISERLQLLRLPELIQEWIGDGQLPTAAGRSLEKVAKISSDLAVWVARATIEDPDVDPSKIDASLHYLITAIREDEVSAVEGMPERPFVIPLQGLVAIDEVDFSERKDLVERLAAIYGDDPVALNWDEDDVDAARAFGCLIDAAGAGRFNNPYSIPYATDNAFVVSRVEVGVDAIEKQIAEEAKEREAAAAAKASKDASGEDASGAGDGAVAGTSEEDEKAERAKENAKRKAAQQSAQLRNEEVGSKASVKLHKPKVTTARMKLLAKLVAAAHPAMAEAGLGLCDNRLIEREEADLKNGKKKVKLNFLGTHDANEVLLTRIEKAKNAEEVLGVILQALVLGTIADTTSRPQSLRPFWHLPSLYGSSAIEPGSIAAEIEKEALAVLPASEAEELRKKRS